MTGAQYDTYEIVKRVRCEMRAAIITYVERSIRRHEGKRADALLTPTPNYLAQLYNNRDKLSPELQQVIDNNNQALEKEINLKI